MLKFNKSVALSMISTFFLLFSTVLFAANKIYDAENNDDIRIFSEAVLSGAIGPNSVMDDGSTALIIFSMVGDIEKTDKLLSIGTDPRKVNNEGLTALIAASAAPSIQELQDIYENDDSLNKAANKEWAEHMFASGGRHVEVVQHLLKAGAEPNKAESNSNGINALTTAIIRKKIEIVKALLEGGANPSMTVEGVSVIDFAQHLGQTEYVNILREYQNRQGKKEL